MVGKQKTQLTEKQLIGFLISDPGGTNTLLIYTNTKPHQSI